MSNFLDRVVSRALAPAGYSAAVGPRFDAGADRGGPTYGNAIEVELETAVGDPESDRTAAATGIRQQFTATPAPAAAQRRGEIVPVPPPVFEKDAPTARSSAARRSAQRPHGELRLPDGPIGTATLDRKTPSAPLERSATQMVHVPAIDRTVRHVARADPAIAVRTVTPLAPVAFRPDAAGPIPIRAATPTFDIPQPAGSHPVLPIQREHPTNMAPRTTVDRAAFRDTGVSMHLTSRGYVTAPLPDAGREPSTVHVTIGRLEIRAPQPAPVMVSRQAEVPRASRLEAYLERRASRGRR
jgi:hypothetical protein